MDNLTIIVPYRNGERHIGRLVDSLPPNVPIIIVDDQSDIALTHRFLHEHCNITDRAIINIYRPDERLYFTGACNYAIARCKTDVLILNQDTFFDGTAWMGLLAENREEYALIGERIRGEHPSFPHSYVHGVFQLMRRDAIESVGLMNADLYPLWGASALWQWEICRAGYKALPLSYIPGLTHTRGEGGLGDQMLRAIHEEWGKRNLFVRTPPEISIVVPSFNHGQYLPDLLSSLFGGKSSLGEMQKQSMQSFEVVIVDDCSTDDSWAIMEFLEDLWSGVRIYRNAENVGTAATLNRAIKRSTGKYICVMCADDMREPWSLSDLYAAQLRNPHKVIYDDPTITNGGQRRHLMRLPEYDFEQLIYKNQMHVGLMYPRQAWIDAGGYPEAMIYGREDWAFNVALGRAGWCGHKIERSGYLYRRDGQNRTEHNTTPEWMARFAQQMRQLFPGIYRGERTMACCGSSNSRAIDPQAAAARAAAVAPMPDADDMILIQYEGSNYGTTTWGGPNRTASGRVYRFGAGEEHYQKYIMREDWPWFEERREGGIDLFSIVEEEQPAQTPIEPHESPVVDESTNDEGAVVDAPTEEAQDAEGDGSPDADSTDEEGSGSDGAEGEQPAQTPTETEDAGEEQAQDGQDMPIPDPSTLTVAEAKELEMSPLAWGSLLEMERGGKNRKGIIEWAEEQSASE